MLNDANVEDNWDDVGVLFPFDQNFIDAKYGIGPAEITGAPSIQTSQTDSKFSGSISFANSSRLRYSDGANTTIGSADFTIEFWIYPKLIGSGPGTSGSVRGIFTNTTILNTGITNKTLMVLLNNDDLYLELAGVTTGSSVKIGTYMWTHVAFARSGSNLMFFVDGTLIHTYASATFNFSSSNIILGGANIGSWSHYSGNIDDFRFTKGTARYTESFNPPSRAYSIGNTIYEQYNNFPMVQLLGKNGLVDSSFNNRPLNPTNPPNITYDVPFIDGSPTYHFHKSVVCTHTVDDFKLGLNDFTIEAWVNTANLSGYNAICSSYGFPLRNNFMLSINNEYVYVSYGIGNGTTYMNFANFFNINNTYTGSVPANKWCHVAWTRKGNTNRIFLNGKLAKTFTNKTNWTSNTIVVGAAAGAAKTLKAAGGKYWWEEYYFEQNHLTGYINDFQVTNLICKYTTDFDPSETYITNRPNELSSFTGSNIDITYFAPKILSTIYTDQTINSNIFKFNDGSGFVLKKPISNIPGVWISDATVSDSGDCTITLSDDTIYNIGNISDSNVPLSFDAVGTGLLSSVSGNTLTFNPLTVTGDATIIDAPANIILSANVSTETVLSVKDSFSIAECTPVSEPSIANPAGNWNTRKINTIYKTMPGVKLDNGLVRMPVGKYYVDGMYNVYTSGYTGLRLFDVDAGIEIIQWNNGYAVGTSSTSVDITGEFILISNSTVAVQMYSTTASSGWTATSNNTIMAVIQLTFFKA